MKNRFIVGLMGGVAGFAATLSALALKNYTSISDMLLKERLNPQLTKDIYENLARMSDKSLYGGIIFGALAGVLGALTIYESTSQNSDEILESQRQMLSKLEKK